MNNIKDSFDNENYSRRKFLIKTGIITVSAVTGGSMLNLSSGCNKNDKEEISPGEDLMREHGLLNRVLLIYEEIINKINTRSDFSPDSLRNAGEVVKEFVEDYHEKNEEDYLFPRMQKEGMLVDLVTTLKTQHDTGRLITQYIINNAQLNIIKNEVSAKALTDKITAFVRMYRPHEAREDTVLFPAFRKLLSSNEYDSLGEDFEKIEKEKFGEDGFKKYLDRVVSIEQQLGINDINKYTPGIW